MPTNVAPMRDDRNWRAVQSIGQTTPNYLRALRLLLGSRRPEVQPACRFVAPTGGWAARGAIEGAVSHCRNDREWMP